MYGDTTPTQPSLFGHRYELPALLSGIAELHEQVKTELRRLQEIV